VKRVPVIHSEDITGLPDLRARPAELEFGTFGGHPVRDIPSLPRSVLSDLERALVDRGWRWGVRSCTVTITRTLGADKKPETHLKARLTYA